MQRKLIKQLMCDVNVVLRARDDGLTEQLKNLHDS